MKNVAKARSSLLGSLAVGLVAAPFAVLLAACSSTSGGAPDEVDAALPPADPDAAIVEPPPVDAAPEPPVDAGPADAGQPAPPPELALTPPMGWNTWNKFGCDIDEDLVKQMADALVATGMKDLGYQYVVIDDCWQASARDASGALAADATRFPSGIAALAEYVHAKGLKLGIYTDAGSKSCQGRPGSQGKEALDAATFAAWGVDYIKVNWCNTGGLDPKTQYTIMREAIHATGRDMILAMSSWGEGEPWIWGAVTGQLWRTTDGIGDNWGSMIGIADTNQQYSAFARPGAWNDPDILQVGNGGMNDSEYKVHMSLWAIMAAPLMAGNDLRNMSQATRNVLVNERVVAIDQDPLGVQGVRIRDNGDQEVWVKPLATPGQRAVALVNRGGSNASMTVGWSEIGLAGGNAGVLDVWKLVDNGPTPDAYTATVSSHGVVLLIVSGSEPAAPTGTVYVSDLPLTHTSNYWGPVERDKSNGEENGGDGKPIKLSGIGFSKGLGVHAGSLVRVNLGGNCSTFTAKIGVDDEVGDKGSVVFEVWSGAERLYTSGLLTGASPMEDVSVDVTGKADLRLVVLAGFDHADHDHADWADAQLACN